MAKCSHITKCLPSRAEEVVKMKYSLLRIILLFLCVLVIEGKRIDIGLNAKVDKTQFISAKRNFPSLRNCDS